MFFICFFLFFSLSAGAFGRQENEAGIEHASPLDGAKLLPRVSVKLLEKEK
jgi:hypothetical protein